MSRQTYSLSAAAIVAIGSLSFSSVDNAVAFAQDVVAGAGQESIESADPASEAVEMMPDQPVFVSEEVVQALPQPVMISTAGDYEAGSLSELVNIVDDDGPLSEELRCLAGAVYFESRGEPLAGQLAVAQVVINRADDPRWPVSYCGVVFQRSQFSFVRNGRMPDPAIGSEAWDRARSIARIAHNGMWQSEAAEAVYFHASYVRPRWSRSKTPLAQINTHVFYR